MSAHSKKSIFEELTEGITLVNLAGWDTFRDRLSAAVSVEAVRRIRPLFLYYSSIEEWYVDPTSGDIFVYVPFNGDKGFPKFEKVDVFSPPIHKQPVYLNDVGLSGFKVGPQAPESVRFIEYVLELWLKSGEIQEVASPAGDVLSIRTFHEWKTGRWFQLARDELSGTAHWNQVQPPTENSWLPS